MPLTIVNVAPTLVQTLGLPELYDTGGPKLAVAATVKLALTNALAGAGSVTVTDLLAWPWSSW